MRARKRGPDGVMSLGECSIQRLPAGSTLPTLCPQSMEGGKQTEWCFMVGIISFGLRDIPIYGLASWLSTQRKILRAASRELHSLNVLKVRLI